MLGSKARRSCGWWGWGEYIDFEPGMSERLSHFIPALEWFSNAKFSSSANLLLQWIDSFEGWMTSRADSTPIAPRAKLILLLLTLFFEGCAFQRVLALEPKNGPILLDSMLLWCFYSSFRSSLRVLYKLNQIELEFIAEDVNILA